MWTVDDARLPTEGQRNALVHLMYLAFVDLRALCLARYQEKHGVREGFDYVAELNKITRME